MSVVFPPLKILYFDPVALDSLHFLYKFCTARQINTFFVNKNVQSAIN